MKQSDYTWSITEKIQIYIVHKSLKCESFTQFVKCLSTFKGTPSEMSRYSRSLSSFVALNRKFHHSRVSPSAACVINHSAGVGGTTRASASERKLQKGRPGLRLAAQGIVIPQQWRAITVETVIGQRLPGTVPAHCEPSGRIVFGGQFRLNILGGEKTHLRLI